MIRALVPLLLVGALLTPSLASATSQAAGPDAHDRALARQLVADYQRAGHAATKAAKSVTQGAIAKKLSACGIEAQLKKNPSKAMVVVFGLVPAMLIDVSHQLQPELAAYDRDVQGLHPQALVFRRWLANQHQGLQSLLAVVHSSSGRVDYCQAAKALIANDERGYARALGISESELAKIEKTTVVTPPSLAKAFKAFLVKAGVKPSVASQVVGG